MGLNMNVYGVKHERLWGKGERLWGKGERLWGMVRIADCRGLWGFVYHRFLVGERGLED